MINRIELRGRERSSKPAYSPQPWALEATDFFTYHTQTICIFVI